MEFFDTHSHYNDQAYDEDRSEILKKVYDSGVTKTVVIGYNEEKSKMAVEIANEFDYIYAAVGIHPSDIGDSEEEICKQIENIKEIVINDRNTSNRIVAIGEIGLDYHWDKEKKELQKFAFVKQIELANELELPIVIHSRDSIMDTVNIIENEHINYSGILHCCTLNEELIRTGIKAGLYTSFAGPITYKNTKNTELIKSIPVDRILIETDCPYLSPEPNRGKRNDSRNIKLTAQKMAEILDKSLEEIASITYTNGLKVYKIR